MTDIGTIRPLVEQVVSEVLAAELSGLTKRVVELALTRLEPAQRSEGSGLLMERLESAINAAHATQEQDETLLSLFHGASMLAPRCALFLVRDEALAGCRASGFSENEAIHGVKLPLEECGDLLGTALRGLGNHSARGAVTQFDPGFAARFEAPWDGNCVLVPVALPEGIVALVYADAGTQSGEGLNAAALEVLVRVTCTWMELLVLRKLYAASVASHSAQVVPDAAADEYHADTREAVPAEPGNVESAPLPPPMPADSLATTETAPLPPLMPEISSMATAESAPLPSLMPEVPSLEATVSAPEPSPRMEVSCLATTVSMPEVSSLATTASTPVQSPMPEVSYLATTAPMPAPSPMPEVSCLATTVSASEPQSVPAESAPGIPESAPEMLPAAEVSCLATTVSTTEPSSTPEESAPAVTEPAFEPLPEPEVSGPAVPASASVPATPMVSDTEMRARRFARLLVDEIKLYNHAKVAEGKQNADLYERLRSDIEKSRATYDKRYANTPIAALDFFTHELVRNLADNNPDLLGSSFSR